MAVPRPAHVDPPPDPDPDSLRVLLELAGRGETAALARVVRLRHESLTRVAVVVTLDPATAAAAVDEVWPSAWRTLRGRGVPEDPEAWLAGLAVDEARHVVGHRGEALDGPSPPDPSAIPLLALPARDRAGLALRLIAGIEPARPRGPLARVRAARTSRRLTRLERGLDPAALRAWAGGVRIAPVNADAAARRAAAEVQLERGRRLSVAIGAVAGLLVAGAPVLLPLIARH